MNCYIHPDIPATATCADCGEPICAACTRMLDGRAFCTADYELAGYEGGDVNVPLTVPAYHLEKKTKRIPPHHERLALVEKYEGPTNFIYSPAVNIGIQPQQTAEILAQYEETRTVMDANGEGYRDRTLRWAVIGLVCAITTIGIFTLLTLGYNISNPSTNDPALTVGIAVILSLITTVFTLWTINIRQDSSRPRLIVLIGLIGLIILAIFWIRIGFLLHDRSVNLDNLLRQKFPDLYK